jgi:hypothetical protein
MHRVQITRAMILTGWQAVAVGVAVAILGPVLIVGAALLIILGWFYLFGGPAT